MSTTHGWTPRTRRAYLATRLRRDATLLAWYAWQRLDAVLPRRVCSLLATGLGEILYLVLPNKRAAVLENMAHVLGPGATPEDVRLVARRSWHNFARYLSEFTHLPRWSVPDMERLVGRVEGLEHIAGALSDGKGVILVTPHFGNWDVAGFYLGQRYTFSAIAEHLRPPELDDLVQGWRQAKRIGIIPLENAARGVLRSLQRGGIVAIVVDRPVHARGEGVPVRLFGEWTRVPAGAAHFALRTGAPVSAGGFWRTPDNTYEALLLPPRRFGVVADAGEREREAPRVMQRIMEDIEHVIRLHPEQWYMFRRMWPGPPRPASLGVLAGGEADRPGGGLSASRLAPVLAPVPPAVPGVLRGGRRPDR